MSKKNKRGESAGTAAANGDRSGLGVGASGSALRQNALLAAALVLIPALLAAAYLFLLRSPQARDQLVDAVSVDFAQQRAQVVAAAVTQLRDRAQAATQSRIALDAIASGEGDALREAERSMLEFFPDVVSLRLIPLGDLGTAGLDERLESLRNHIELDLVRRVSNDEEAMPEAYEANGEGLASIAQMAVHPDMPERRAVVLLTVSRDALGDLVAPAGDTSGRYTLRQRIFGNGVDSQREIISRGTGVAASGAVASVEGTNWLVEFAPSQILLDDTSAAARRDLDVLIAVLLLAMAAIALFYARARAALDRDATRIVDGAEHKSSLDLRFPALVPVARELRRATQRPARSTTVASVEEQRVPDTGAAMISAEGPAEKELPAHIFRAYDIRGVADTDLDDEIAYRIGSAIGTIAGETGEQTIALGYDGRSSSSRIKAVVEKALLQSGRDVIDIGLVPTPLLYFATQHSKARSGVMVTGSHSPADVNGLKIVLNREALSEGAIGKIRNLAQTGQFSKGTGHRVQENLISTYLDEVIGDIAIAVPLRIVVDAGNGATGHVAPTLLEELGCEVIPMHCEIDGSFPNRSPDTGRAENLRGLVAAVAEHGADFGVAYDGDGDRLAVVTGSGRIVATDVLLMLLARDVVARHPGADVVYDVKCTRNLARLVTSLGGRPVLWKTGHALMKKKMAETGALIGGEFSGHIFFGERWYGFDDGMYTTARLAEILSSQSLGLDELLADLPTAVSTPEILIPVDEEDKFPLIKRFVAEARFADGKRNDLDGLRVDFDDGWGLLRASNTGAALTARFEGSTEAALERIRGAFRDELQRIAPELGTSF